MFFSVSTDPIPYGLRYAEDFVACNLVIQAVIGHEDRLVFSHNIDMTVR